MANTPPRVYQKLLVSFGIRYSLINWRRANWSSMTPQKPSWWGAATSVGGAAAPSAGRDSEISVMVCLLWLTRPSGRATGHPSAVQIGPGAPSHSSPSGSAWQNWGAHHPRHHAD